MRFRSSVQRAASLVALTLIFGCGGAGSENSAAEKAAADAIHDAEATMEQTDMGEVHEHVAGAAVCPVSGHDVDPAKAVMVTYEGREIQLCCQDCVQPFNNDPAKYMAKLDMPEESHEGHDH